MLKDRSLISLLILSGVILIPVVLYFIPLDWIINRPSICLFENLTGHECYGCGMTRAIFYAIHLRFREAFQFNKLYPVVFPLLIYIWIKTILSLWPGFAVFINSFHNNKRGNGF